MSEDYPGPGGFELGEFDFIAAKFQMAVGVWFCMVLITADIAAQDVSVYDGN